MNCMIWTVTTMVVSIDLQYSQSPQFLLAGVIGKADVQMVHARLKPARMDKAEAAR